MWRLVIRQNIQYNETVELWFEDVAKATTMAQAIANAVPTIGKTQVSIIGEMDFTEKEESNGED